MKSITVVLFSIFAVAISGCGGGDGVVPVSGTITYKEQPVAKLQVVFSPQPVGDNHAVGPYSSGVTDSSGKFTLKTRYGDSGAVVGKHSLSFEYSDIGESAMSDARAAMNDARDEGDREGIDKAKKKLADIRAKLKGRPILKGSYNKAVEVPSGGSEDFKIELTELGN